MPPELEDGDRSPIKELAKMEWDSVDKELEEFMGSDAEDSDMDSTTDFGDTDREDEQQRSQGLKRKYGDDLEDEEETGGSEGRSSALAKKQRLAKARTTGLRNVKNIADDDSGGGGGGGGEAGSGLPTPMGTGDGEDNGAAADGGEDGLGGGADREENDDDDDDDDGFSDLEAEFEAELQAGMDDAG